MKNNRLDEIERIKNEVPKINITPTFSQSILISVSFFGLAVALSLLADAV